MQVKTGISRAEYFFFIFSSPFNCLIPAGEKNPRTNEHIINPGMPCCNPQMVGTSFPRR